MFYADVQSLRRRLSLFVTVFLFQLHHLKSLRLDYSFVSISGAPGLILRHAFFFAPKGTMSTQLSNYGGLWRQCPAVRVSQGNWGLP